MALGKFSDLNLAKTAVLSGGTWAASLPLANMKDDARYVGAPARCPDCTSLAKSKFYVTLETTRSVSLVMLMFHTMSPGGLYRVSGIGPGGSWLTPDLQTAWTPVFASLFDSHELEYEEENWFTGQLPSSEQDLYPRHCTALFEPVLISDLMIEINDVVHPDGFFDIGGLWVSSTWSAEMNFQRGMDLTMESRDQQDEAPSGRVFTEERTPRRYVTVTYDASNTAEARRWIDAGARARSGRTVIFIPDADDEAGRVRDAFPAMFGNKLPGARFNYPTLNPSTLTFKEIIA
ncbi:hypothetical protein BH10PSE5_BH10PSE5_19550 [soil metagenome]